MNPHPHRTSRAAAASAARGGRPNAAVLAAVTAVAASLFPACSQPPSAEPKTDTTIDTATSDFDAETETGAVAADRLEPVSEALTTNQPQQNPSRPPLPSAALTTPATRNLVLRERRSQVYKLSLGRTVPGGATAAPGHDRESYERIDEAGFVAVGAEPQSTFSIDVDTAAYSNVRRMLTDGQLPPHGAVRIEELLNYFDYDYPQPIEGEGPFATFVEAGACPWNAEHRLVHIGLQGALPPAAEQAPPRNLVFLLDVSGSMQSRDKLPLLKSAMNVLVDQLREQDTVAITVYAGASGLALPPTSGADAPTIRSAIANLEAGGSTNGAAGIRLAYQTARESFRDGAINRVILATDGDFNVGVSSDDELVRLIERERDSGVFLTVLGLGRGNLNDSMMEKLSNHGNGNYAYLDSTAEARKVLGQQIGGTLHTIAKDVKIQVEFNPRLVKGYRLIGYENRVLAAADFDDDTKDAGEIGAGHSVTALYEVVPVGASTTVADAPELHFQAESKPTAAAGTDDLMFVKVRSKQPDGETSTLRQWSVADRGPNAETTREFDFAAAVAMFGMLLRDSELRGTASFGLAHELAEGALGADAHGHRKGFLALVDRAMELQSVGTK